MNKEVNTYIKKARKWQKELEVLRSIVLECGLVEEYKWKQPCYTFEGANVAILSEFKEYCSLSFFKGALLKDQKDVLVKPGEKSRSTCLIKFTSVSEITKLKATIKAYLKEAIKIEKQGLKVDFKKDAHIPVPQELLEQFKKDKKFKEAFDTLTPGRRRGYLLFFSGAKQSATVTARIEKFKHRILKGYGMNDCVCGLSKRMPGCDGSHKQLKK